MIRRRCYHFHFLYILIYNQNFSNTYTFVNTRTSDVYETRFPPDEGSRAICNEQRERRNQRSESTPALVKVIL